MVEEEEEEEALYLSLPPFGFLTLSYPKPIREYLYSIQNRVQAKDSKQPNLGRQARTAVRRRPDAHPGPVRTIIRPFERRYRRGANSVRKGVRMPFEYRPNGLLPFGRPCSSAQIQAISNNLHLGANSPNCTFNNKTHSINKTTWHDVSHPKLQPPCC